MGNWRGALAAVAAWAALVPHAHASAARMAKARAQIHDLITASGAEVAVAFQTLDGKDKLLIQPDEVFHAASTMKIPVMIELFAQAKARRLRLDDPLLVKNEFKSIVDGGVYQITPGAEADADVFKRIGEAVPLRQLCEAMITVSSNLATNLLIERLGVQNVRARVHNLHADGMQVRRGVEDGQAFAAGINNTTTARALMRLLDRIASGKAVDRVASREMIAILERQRLNEAIPAGLPPETPVAHKTGEITRIHHDAAVVYSKRPFLLVVLVRGVDEKDKSSALMADITRALYRATQ